MGISSCIFEDADAEKEDWQYFKKVQNGYGRVEVREIWTSTQMNDWFGNKWAGIAQIFKIRRRVMIGDKEREEIVYGFTNLERTKANARRLLKLNQQHCSIENRLRYRRDVILGEDVCHARKKNALQVVAAINGGILVLMDWLGVKNVAKQMHYFCAQPQEVLQLLCGKLAR